MEESIVGHEMTIYSYEKINEIASLTHVNVVVVDSPPPPSFGHNKIGIKNGKNSVKVRV
jgi:hypothetical protein